jgi:GTP-binding protein
MEAAGLGFGEPLLVSAENNYMRRDFLDQLYEIVAKLPGAGELAPVSPEMKIAIIGKRNAGKSTLVNTLAGEQAGSSSPRSRAPHRDAVDVRFEMSGHTFIAIDTAGLRRKKSFENRIEWWAFDRVQKSIDRADVVLLLVDATEPVSQVDQQLAMLAQKTFKPVVIVVNKWDMVEGQNSKDGQPITPEMFEGIPPPGVQGPPLRPDLVRLRPLRPERPRDHRARLRAAPPGPSARRHRRPQPHPPHGDRQAWPRLQARHLRQGLLRRPSGHRPPHHRRGREPPRLFTVGYQRFLLNRLREVLPYPEVPIKLIVAAVSAPTPRTPRSPKSANASSPKRATRPSKNSPLKKKHSSAATSPTKTPRWKRRSTIVMMLRRTSRMMRQRSRHQALGTRHSAPIPAPRHPTPAPRSLPSPGPPSGSGCTLPSAAQRSCRHPPRPCARRG